MALNTKAKYEYSYIFTSTLRLLGILQNSLYLISLLQMHIITELTRCYQSFYLPTDAQESCFKRILKFTYTVRNETESHSEQRTTNTPIRTQ